ncbi:MAG: hypothetical protein Q8N43_02880, partial [Candidatus Azambacteria bacterium]|nr:hypothetical protein [Candidatus Azambacteria bacterium]
NLALAFDMDEAGARATERGDLMAIQSGFNISVVSLLSGKDPADFVKENPGKFSKIVNTAEPIMSYYFKLVFKKFSAYGEDEIPLEGKKFIAVDLLSKIKRLHSAVERNNWIRELSLRISVPERDLSEEMERSDAEIDMPLRNTVVTEGQSSSQRKAISARGRKEILSERLLALLLKKPELIAEAVKAAVFLPKKDFEFLGVLIANQKSFSETRAALSVDLRPRLDFLYLSGDYELEKAGADFDINKEIKFLIEEIKREHYKEILQKIGQEIKKCEARPNDAVGQAAESPNLNKLTEEFKNISKKLYELNKYEKEKSKKS